MTNVSQLIGLGVAIVGIYCAYGGRRPEKRKKEAIPYAALDTLDTLNTLLQNKITILPGEDIVDESQQDEPFQHVRMSARRMELKRTMARHEKDRNSRLRKETRRRRIKIKVRDLDIFCVRRKISNLEEFRP